MKPDFRFAHIAIGVVGVLVAVIFFLWVLSIEARQTTLVRESIDHLHVTHDLVLVVENLQEAIIGGQDAKNSGRLQK